MCGWIYIGGRGKAARGLGKSRVEILAAYAARCRGSAAQFGGFAAVSPLAGISKNPQLRRIPSRNSARINLVCMHIVPSSSNLTSVNFNLVKFTCKYTTQEQEATENHCGVVINLRSGVLFSEERESIATRESAVGKGEKKETFFSPD